MLLIIGCLLVPSGFLLPSRLWLNTLAPAEESEARCKYVDIRFTQWHLFLCLSLAFSLSQHFIKFYFLCNSVVSCSAGIGKRACEGATVGRRQEVYIFTVMRKRSQLCLLAEFVYGRVFLCQTILSLLPSIFGSGSGRCRKLANREEERLITFCDCTFFDELSCNRTANEINLNTKHIQRNYSESFKLIRIN